MKHGIKILTFIFLVSLNGKLSAQSVSFGITAHSDNITFDFNTIQSYLAGKTFYNAYELMVDVSGSQFDLYVGATTSVPGFFDVVSTYSSTGTTPPVSILQMQFRNSMNTSLMSGFFPLTDISTPTYIIGTPAAPDLSISCPNVGTNVAGSYLTNPGCYKFNLDLKIVPGFSYKPGLYTLRIDYILIQDL
ncbi:MAG: hypothetical protein JXR34_10055 [Bacteroidales bacterium]|nr:hypothetical protein [Bacteroidales bacterium]